MAVKSRAELLAEIASDFTSNGTGAITGTLLNQQQTNVVDSVVLGNELDAALATKQDASANLSTWSDKTPPSGTVLGDNDIGVSVQAHSDNLDEWSDKTAPTGTVLGSGDIGITVQAFSSNLNTWAGKVAPTGDVVGTSDSQVLTNKTINGTANVISNLTTTAFIAGAIVTTFLSPSNSSLPTSQGVYDLFSTVSSGNFHDACNLATTTSNANITLSGEQLIDSTTTNASRVLVKNETTTASLNGAYNSSAGAWARVSDANSGTSIVNAAFPILSGATNSGTIWICTTPSPISLGTTSIGFTVIPNAGAYSAVAPVTLTANQFSVATSSQAQAVAGASTTTVLTPLGGAQQIQGYSFLATGTTKSRIMPDRFADNLNVANFDNGTSLAAFQAAVNVVTNGKNAIIGVPSGNYADDYKTLSMGTRNICWQELGPVTYSTSTPPGVRFGGNPLSGVGGFGFGFDRTSEQGAGLPNKPTLVIRRVTNHTSGIAGAAEPGPLVLRHEVPTSIDNYETTLYATLDIDAAPSGAQSFTGGRFQVRKSVTGTASMFGFNPSTQDTTLRKSSVSGGVMVVQENDWVGLGPDDSNVRSLLDLIPRSYQVTQSVDGDTSIAYGMRVIPSRSSSFAKVEVKNAIWIGVDTSTGSVASTITKAIHIENCTQYGLDILGNAPSGGAIHVYHNDANPGVIQLGGQVTTGEMARLSAYGKIVSGAETQFGYLSFLVDSNATSTRTGRAQIGLWSSGTEIVMFRIDPNNDASNPMRMRIGGTLKKLTVDASGFVKAA